MVSSFTPLPSSPSRGEVSLRVWGRFSRQSPELHLPLEGGGWEGVALGVSAGKIGGQNQ
jgi:hypothetical protein